MLIEDFTCTTQVKVYSKGYKVELFPRPSLPEKKQFMTPPLHSIEEEPGEGEGPVESRPSLCKTFSDYGKGNSEV
jgi:hypothetical protein